MPKTEPLLTVAEASRYTRTALHEEVAEFVRRLAQRTDRMSVQSMGTSPEGRDIPVLVLSAHGHFSPVAAQLAARESGLPVVMVLCNIHAGEVEGKEAALMLARDVTTGALGRLMERATIVLVPIYNPDGNDRIAPENRRLDLARLDGQVGPEGGVGTRYTGQGLNLNRDYTKLEAVESRLLSRLFGEWNPHLFVDSHTSDGSIHGYALTYDTAHTVASGPAGPILYTREVLLPAVGRKLAERTGLRTWFYGNFRDPDDPASGWETYPGLPRYGSHYRGLTGRLDVLLEAYSYSTFEERVRVTYEILVELLDHAGEHGREIVEVCDRATADTIARGAMPAPEDVVGIHYGVASRDPSGRLAYRYPAWPLMEHEIESYDLETVRGRRIEGGTRRTWRNVFYCRFLPEVAVRRPLAYVVPKERGDVVEHLRLHNVVVGEAGPRGGDLEVEQYVVLAKDRTVSPDVGYEEREETVLFVRRERALLRVDWYDFLVPMDQPLAHVAIYLLEPESDDGLVRWGRFDELVPGDVYPVRRLVPTSGSAPPPGARRE